MASFELICTNEDVVDALKYFIEKDYELYADIQSSIPNFTKISDAETAKNSIYVQENFFVIHKDYTLKFPKISKMEKDGKEVYFLNQATGGPFFIFYCYLQKVHNDNKFGKLEIFMNTKFYFPDSKEVIGQSDELRRRFKLIVGDIKRLLGFKTKTGFSGKLSSRAYTATMN
jgi:hypothetical protein